jgi:hypothetical protein
MPIPVNTQLSALPEMFTATINAYNTPGSRTANYNFTYHNFIRRRSQGIAIYGNIAGWINNGDAADTIHGLLVAFGMNVQGSVLVPAPLLQATLLRLSAGIVNWIETFSLPLPLPPCNIINPATQQSLAKELQQLFYMLSLPGAVTLNGGFVAASKTLHCLFPDLAPMIDGRHSGLSYFYISRDTYTPPLDLQGWHQWNGGLILGVPNPSPRGAGRFNWDAGRFITAIGINQHIYEIWQTNNNYPGLQAFLTLDPAQGTTGIPRIIDKLLW